MIFKSVNGHGGMGCLVDIIVVLAADDVFMFNTQIMHIACVFRLGRLPENEFRSSLTREPYIFFSYFQNIKIFVLFSGLFMFQKLPDKFLRKEIVNNLCRESQWVYETLQHQCHAN